MPKNKPGTQTKSDVALREAQQLVRKHVAEQKNLVEEIIGEHRREERGEQEK